MLLTQAQYLARQERLAKRRAAGDSHKAMPKPRREPDQDRYSGRLAKRLRAARDAAGIAPDDLATKLTKAGYKVSAPTLYAWENGRLQIQLDALPYLAKALRTTVSELMPEK